MGNTELFYSFEDENPKSENDYIQNTGSQGGDYNFIEKSASKSENENIFYRMVRAIPFTPIRNVITDNLQKKYYQINRPASGQNELLYFSVKGFEIKNEFQVYVYNRTVVENSGYKFKFSKLNGFIFILSTVYAYFYFYL